jgi:hypothetical protein
VELDGNVVFQSKDGHTHNTCDAYEDLLEMVELVKKGSTNNIVRERIPVLGVGH